MPLPDSFHWNTVGVLRNPVSDFQLLLICLLPVGFWRVAVYFTGKCSGSYSTVMPFMCTHPVNTAGCRVLIDTHDPSTDISCGAEMATCFQECIVKQVYFKTVLHFINISNNMPMEHYLASSCITYTNPTSEIFILEQTPVLT